MTGLAIRVQPGAKANEIVGWISDASGGEVLKIRLRAAAVEGKANAALLEFLAASLGLRPRQIVLVRGEKSRDKVVEVNGPTEAEIKLRIGLSQ
jgi:uncharacterized protein (TIGR00251 family)